jgi:hypothetical protein
MMQIWLPKPIYIATPYFCLLGAMSLMLLNGGVIVQIFAVYVCCYSVTIFILRYFSRKEVLMD